MDHLRSCMSILKKSIRVHSRNKFLKGWIGFFSFLIMKKPITSIYYFRYNVKKRTHLGCQNISKHIETSDNDDIVVGRNYYFRVTKTCMRENNHIRLSAFQKKSLIYGLCIFFKSWFIKNNNKKKITRVAVFIFRKDAPYLFENI